MLKFLMSRSSAYRFAVFLWRPFPVAIKEENRFILYLLVKNKTNANFFEVVVLLI